MRCSRGAVAFEVCQRPQRVPAVAVGIQQQSYEAGKKWLDIPADQRELADQTGLAQVRSGRVLVVVHLPRIVSLRIR